MRHKPSVIKKYERRRKENVIKCVSLTEMWRSCSTNREIVNWLRNCESSYKKVLLCWHVGKVQFLFLNDFLLPISVMTSWTFGLPTNVLLWFARSPSRMPRSWLKRACPSLSSSTIPTTTSPSSSTRMSSNPNSSRTNVSHFLCKGFVWSNSRLS